MNVLVQRFLASTAAASLLLAAGAAQAHADKAHAPAPAGPVKKEQKDWGVAGDAKAVKVTVRHDMKDTMRFTPEFVKVKLGDTVRFVVHNSGKVMHEFVIGTKKENLAHAELMKKFPGMEHDEPYMAHVAPGKTAEIVWTFNRPGEFEFACLIAGHYEAGMKGTIQVRPETLARQ
ncbi:MAG: cupredoxin family protein [Burkholderiales bacterium]|nr:cupredoxin family protein [Burkholderiales bacterium]